MALVSSSGADTRVSRGTDVVTVVSVAVLAYALANFLHEAIGHGGACVVVGGKPLVLSSVHFECGEESISAAARRLVAAAGTVVNFLAAGISLIAMRIAGVRRPRLAYFLWLFTTINLLMGAGYFLFSGLGNIGDWASVCRGMPPLIWRPGLALAGGILYYVFARTAARWLRPLVGSDEAAATRARGLAVPSYIAGGALFCISGLFNPVSPMLIGISAAAASLGGTSGLLWLTQFVRGGQDASITPVSISRSIAWIVGALIVAIVFIGVLGASIRF
ncbi:MAG: hypothetical protein DMF57_17560 [Acidobacteria bacterium]|nr:MAG: hypothetical protein DMF57_17560 [Acidobacteriota bacterium]